MAYEPAKHGLVTAACEANGGDMVLVERLQVVAVDDLVIAVVGEVWFEMRKAN